MTGAGLGLLTDEEAPRHQPRASGGQRSEVKEESRYSGSGDMSAVGYPMTLAPAPLGMLARASHDAAHSAAIHAWRSRSATNNHDEDQR